MRESPSYISTKVIDVLLPIPSGTPISLFDDYGLSETIHLFGIVGTTATPLGNSGVTSSLSCRDGLTGDDFFKFDVTGGQANSICPFVFMLEDDSYIRINQGLVLVPESSSSAAFSQLALTVIYQ